MDQSEKDEVAKILNRKNYDDEANAEESKDMASSSKAENKENI